MIMIFESYKLVDSICGDYMIVIHHDNLLNLKLLDIMRLLAS